MNREVRLRRDPGPARDAGADPTVLKPELRVAETDAQDIQIGPDDGPSEPPQRHLRIDNR